MSRSKQGPARTEKLRELLDQLVRPGTWPVAVKLFGRQPKALPEGTVFPLTFFDHPINFCQGVSIARRYGWKVAFRFEDNACPMFVAYFGFREMPEMVTEGEMCFPIFTENKKLGALAEASLAVMPQGKVKLVFMEPLSSHLSFDPDLVLVYGNGSQMTKLIAAANYRKGTGIEGGPFTARGACSSSIVKPFLVKDFRISIPGGGERLSGHTADDELVFSIPYKKIDDLIFGLEATNRLGTARYPTHFKGMQIEPTFPGKYKKLGDHFGMKIKEKRE
jgi:uncharacterized protein (DUF169 family)